MAKVLVKTDVVKEQLIRRGISQNNLALRTGVSQGYMSQLLHRQRNPGPRVRERMMDALRIQEFDALFEIAPDGQEQAA